LTTLKNRHVRIDGARLTFRFLGKSGQKHAIELTDRRLARIVRECQELPGYALFEDVTEAGETRAVDSADVNEYIREISGQSFTAKDFRTWFGTVLAVREFCAAGRCRTRTAAKRAVVGAIKNVAKRLGNRPATCRKYYIHPAVIVAQYQEKLARSRQSSPFRGFTALSA